MREQKNVQVGPPLDPKQLQNFILLVTHRVNQEQIRLASTSTGGLRTRLPHSMLGFPPLLLDLVKKRIRLSTTPTFSNLELKTWVVLWVEDLIARLSWM